MNVFSAATDEKNNAAESKCENYFPLNKLDEIFKMTKGNYFVRKHLIFFFYNVYLEKELVINYPLIISKMMHMNT